MNILMLSSTFPYPPTRGGTEIRTFNLLKYLQQHHQITLVTQRHSGVTDTEVAELRQWVKELVIFTLPPEPTQLSGIKGLVGKVSRFSESLIKATPPNVLYRYSPEIQAWVDDFVKSGKCDVITCEHSVNEIYVRPEFKKSVKTIVDIHSSVYGWIRDHLDMGASPNAVRDRLYLNLLLERYEKRYSSKFNYLVVTTEEDKQQFLKYRSDAKIPVIPNGVDLELFPYQNSNSTGHKLAFVGAMDASHNIDAVRFFALEVLPELQKTYPKTTFSIVGARPTPEVLALAKTKGVIVTGKVPSMVEYLHESTICVVPLRAGYGIKNKTLEAMAAGTPVVGSDRGLEGLAADTPNVPLRALRANSIPEYINAITRLFENPELRQELSKNGRDLVETEYTWSRAGKLYEQVITDSANCEF